MIRWTLTKAFAFLIAVSATTACSAISFPGMANDGMTSFYYVATTGEFGIQPDGQSIGMFEIQSDSGVFTAEAVFPPNSLGVDFNTSMRKSWTALPANGFTTDFSLGVIASPGLERDFLLNDLTALAGRGFGTATDSIGLVYLIPEPSTLALLFCSMAGVSRLRRNGF